jgi:LysR family glycine cleavage system transcriptional activator
MRRSLPPLNPLRSFEAAARHLSYTLAAEELSVTQVAVSRQVRVLEDYLEVALFERGVRTLRLTDAGDALLPILSDALNRIEAGIGSINMHGRRNTISVQVYVSFAQRWLIPRLRHFRESFPHIEVNLRTSSSSSVSFERNNIDAAIISAIEPPTEHEYRLLANRELIPVCSPELVAGAKLPLDPAESSRFTLLHSLARPQTWHEWLAGAGHPDIKATKGLRFETSVMALDAAVSGMGLAVGIRMLVEEELRSGILVAPFEHVHVSERRYYVVWPKGGVQRAAFAAFLDWLSNEMPIDQPGGADESE